MKSKITITVPRPRRRKNAVRIRATTHAIMQTKRLAIAKLQLPDSYGRTWLFLGIAHDGKGHCYSLAQPAVSATVSPSPRGGHSLGTLTTHQMYRSQGLGDELLDALRKYLGPIEIPDPRRTLVQSEN